MGKISQVERSAMGRIVGWMKEIIKEEKLQFPEVDSDIELIIHGKKRRFPDILIFAKYPDEVACVIEYKPPTPYDPYDPELVDDTYNEACNIPGNFNGAVRYFGTWNTNKFVLWDRKFYDAKSYLNMRLKPYEVAEARTIEDITRTSVEEAIRKFLRVLLQDLHALYFEAKVLPTLPIDEFFVYRLRTAIDSFYIPISEKIQKEAKKRKFKRALRKWFGEQSWMFSDSLEDYDRTARQYTYLIVDKVLFYNALRIHHAELDKIQLPKKLTAEEFRKRIQTYFKEALDIDYEPIFSANFIETIPIPKDIIPALVSFINSLNEKYNFSTIGYEVIGRVFENLIPTKERHILGQYFTRSDVVDLINVFCIKTSEDVVLDTGCGAGTFLTRAYTLMKLKDQRKSHVELLSQLYGIDISKFASHLSTINLSIRGLDEEKNYPNIINSDMFNVLPEKSIPRRYKVKRLSGKHEHIKIPYVSAVVGNPPYTRQEEMEEAFETKYKEKLNQIINHDWNIRIGSRSGIYAYFFLHGAKFLRKDGRFGFVTSNAWLDVDYGKHLQEFFLNNFKIIAIIESKVERWFEDADVDTCITILEKCASQAEKDGNAVKFVQLKHKLNVVIPPGTNENGRFKAIRNLIKEITHQTDYFDNDQLRIFPKLQKDLWDEGYDEDEKSYIGGKWGKYIRAPEIFFKVLEKANDKLIPLKSVAKTLYGIKTGAVEFFYLRDKEIKQLGIEPQFIKNNWVIKSPSESNNIILRKDQLRNRVLMVHEEKDKLKGTNVLKYLKYGEEKEFNKRPTCSSRPKWYDIGVRTKADILWPALIRKSFRVFLNKDKVYCNDKLYEVYLKSTEESEIETICAFANSTLTALFLEFYGRSYGGGGGPLDLKRYELAVLPTIDPKKIEPKYLPKIEEYFGEMCSREIEDIFKELRASSPEEFEMSRVKKDRAGLDKVFFDILSLDVGEREKVYRAVIDLVSSRIEKAKGSSRKGKKKGVSPDAIADGILSELRKEELKRFPEEYTDLSDCKEANVTHEGEPVIDSNLFDGIHIKIGEQVIKCSSEDEARYIRYAILNGHKTIKIPKDKQNMKHAVKQYASIFEKISVKVREIIEDSIPEKKLREKVNQTVWKKLLKRERDKDYPIG